jgi:hypothetical protein
MQHSARRPRCQPLTWAMAQTRFNIDHTDIVLLLQDVARENQWFESLRCLERETRISLDAGPALAPELAFIRELLLEGHFAELERMLGLLQVPVL